MTLIITPEISAAFEIHLNEPVDCHIDGKPILRRDTYPYNVGLGETMFASGYQAAQATQPVGEVCVTKNNTGAIVAVTRQDSEGRILKVIAEVDKPIQVNVDTTNFCWLVELFSSDETDSLGYYHTGFTNLSGESRSTKDPYQARRYATFEEAQKIASSMLNILGVWKAIEHGFHKPVVVQEKQEPILYQTRARPLWGQKVWEDWKESTKDCFDAYKKTPKLTDWEYEARVLMIVTDSLTLASVRDDGMPTSKVERHLRRMLCAQRHGSRAYMDDGEASWGGGDNHRQIDYMREAPEAIELAWREAGYKTMSEQLNQENKLDADEMHKMYCDDTAADDWHRPYENYCAGYRAAIKSKLLNKTQPCKTLCELCVKRGYNFCANVAETTLLPIVNPGETQDNQLEAAVNLLTNEFAKSEAEYTLYAFGNGYAVKVMTADFHNNETSQEQKLQVWFDAMPESNGKSNWTAILHKGDLVEGFQFARSEYKDRVRYDADCMKHLIGQLPDKPDILEYDGDLKEAVNGIGSGS